VRAEPRLRRAHVALAGGFVILGFLDGAWVARLPAVKHQFGLDTGRLGIVIFTSALAATLVLPFAGWLSSRHGSRLPVGVGLWAMAAALGTAAFAPSLAPLLAVMCVFGAGIGIADVAANAHGIELERRLRRPVLSPLHAAWSFGLLGGSAVSAVAAAFGIGIRVQLPVVAAASAIVVLAVVLHLLSGTAADVDTAHFALPRGALALPALLMFCAFFVESAAMTWSAVFLSGPAGASAAVAAGAVVAYGAAMGVARLFGDRLMLRWGIGSLARRSGVLSCLGMALALATRSPVPSLVGFALVGVGCAAIVPALFRFGGSAPGIAQGAGVAAVATAGYAGGLIEGPAIGFLGRGVGLTAALGLVVVAGATVALLGARLEAGSVTGAAGDARPKTPGRLPGPG
jgi:predicted MFS family arabinose efflux permease